jgi:hypothetical protein
MQDAFEQNAVTALLGAQYDYVICGTRFDPSAAVWNTAQPAMPPVDAAAPAEPMDLFDVRFLAFDNSCSLLYSKAGSLQRVCHQA